MRCYASLRVASAGTATLPAGSLYAVANRPLALLEVGAFNTTATETTCAVARFSTAGTAGAAATEMAEDPEITPVGVVAGTHTSTAPTLVGTYVRATLGAAKGAGVIWTFGGRGLIIAQGTGNGIGLLVPDGTGQIWDCYFVWDE
jgi:hypothetical protein